MWIFMIYAKLLLLFLAKQEFEIKEKPLTYFNHMKCSLISYDLVRKQQSQ